MRILIIYNIILPYVQEVSIHVHDVYLSMSVTRGFEIDDPDISRWAQPLASNPYQEH